MLSLKDHYSFDKSVCSFLKSDNPFIHFALIDQECQKKINEFTTSFSFDLNSSLIGFECSLRDEESYGDFHIALDTSSSTLSELYRATAYNDPSWKWTVELLRQWSETGYLAEQGITRIILELDIGSCADWPPKPNLFFCFGVHAPNPCGFITTVLSHLRNKGTSSSFLSSFLPFTQGSCTLSA